MDAARAEGGTLRFDPDETAKHGLTPNEGLVLDAPVSDDVELCVVFGGDGTILRALRRYAGTSVPVFAVNYGEIGFLATIDPDDDGDNLAAGMERAVAGDFETLTLPALAAETPAGTHPPTNDPPTPRRDQRPRDPPPPGHARRAAQLRRRRRGDRQRTLRRHRARHPGRVDRLQPRQRRAGHVRGRRGLRGVVHLAALADRAGARRVAGRPALGAQPLARPGRHLARRPGRRLHPARRGDHGRLPARGGGPRPGSGLVVLP